MFLFKKNYTFDTGIQFDEHYNPCVCGTSVRWLGTVTVNAYTARGAEERALKIVNEKYPQYNGVVGLY